MYRSTYSLTSALDEGGWSTPRPGRFTPRKDSVPIVQVAAWAPGLDWRGAESLAPIGIPFPESPPRCESLHRLSYPAVVTGYKHRSYRPHHNIF
jgi:hypothetical protein